MAESSIQQELLKLFQQQQQQPNIELNTGLLSEGQQGIGDVLANPDQAQVNALVGGLAGLANPRGRDPALMAVAQGAQAFQNTRMQDYQARVQGEKLRQDALKNQIQTATGLGNLQQSIRKGDLAESRFEKVTLPSENRAENLFQQVTLPGEKRAAEKHSVEMGRVSQESFMDPNSGESITLEKGTDGRLRLPNSSQTVDPNAAGLVPFSTTVHQKITERQLGQTDAAHSSDSQTNLLKNIITSPAFSRTAGAGLERATRLGIETLGLGEEQEIVLKNMKQVSADSMLQDIKKLGANPSNADRVFLEKKLPRPQDDDEVWHDYYMNNALPVYHRNIVKAHGQEFADQWLKGQLGGMPPEVLNAANRGTVTYKALGFDQLAPGEIPSSVSGQSDHQQQVNSLVEKYTNGQ